MIVSGVEAHYDLQANKDVRACDANETRRMGVLYNYKRYANSVKRSLIQTFARNVSLLIDIGCGRGGDILKWRDAHVKNVLATDLSAAQLDEARSREVGGARGTRGARGGKAHSRTSVIWMHHDMLDTDLAESIKGKLGVGGGEGLERLDLEKGADAVSCMFSLQFVFRSEAAASALLRNVSSLLRPGGVFFGVAPCADSILSLLEGKSSLRIQPPQTPFVLRLGLEDPERGEGELQGEFGRALNFSLQDTVTHDSDACEDAHEYLLPKTQLVRLADRHGLELLQLKSMLSLGGYAGMPVLSEEEKKVAGLYFAFAFHKRDV